MSWNSGSVSNVRWIPFKNMNGSTAPAFAAMQVTDIGVDNTGLMYLKCDQIGTTFNRQIVFNGPCDVASNSYGSCTSDSPLQALWDSSSAVAGDVYGIKPSQWTLTKNGVGLFTVYGIVDSAGMRFSGFWETPQQLYGYATGSISANATSTSYKIYYGTLGSETDSGFTTVPSALNGGTALVNNDKIGLSLVGSGWLMGKRC